MLTTSSKLLTAKATTSASTATHSTSKAAVHHLEQHFWVNTTHAAPHSTAETSSASKHISRIQEVLSRIVLGLLLRIRKRLVCLTNLLETVLGVLIVWVLVWVVHNGELAVCFLDFGLGGVLLDAEDLVVVLAF